jgi:hypothetical protein
VNPLRNKYPFGQLRHISGTRIFRAEFGVPVVLGNPRYLMQGVTRAKYIDTLFGTADLAL